jgi:hypothetical protein
MKFRALAAIAFTSVATASLAQTFDPNIGPETGGLSTAFRQVARTYAQSFDSSVMASLGPNPVMITGIRFRLFADLVNNGAGGVAWPATSITFSDWTLRIGTSNLVQTDGEFLSLTPTFNSYFDMGDAVTARTGALTITAGDFANTSASVATPNPWSSTIGFTTPFMYTPGRALVYAFSHTGYGTSVPQAFFASGNFASHVSDAISSTAGANLDGSPNGFSNPYMVEFITAPVPEPATMAALGLGTLALLRRRRKA